MLQEADNRIHSDREYTMLQEADNIIHSDTKHCYKRQTIEYTLTVYTDTGGTQ